MNVMIRCKLFGHKAEEKTEDDFSMVDKYFRAPDGQEITYGKGRVTTLWCKYCRRQLGWNGKEYVAIQCAHQNNDLVKKEG